MAQQKTRAADAGGDTKPAGLTNLGEPPDAADRPGWLRYWATRQATLEGPRFDANGVSLEADEVRFVERMLAAGESLRWIPAGSNGADSVGTLPTNDFVWRSRRAIEVEHKCLRDTTPADFRHIARQIAKATAKNARHETVRTVMVDIGDRELSDDVRDRLARYNAGAKRKVHALWVMSQGRLCEIQLHTERRGESPVNTEAAPLAIHSTTAPPG